VSVPVNATPYFLPEADGIVAKQGKTQADLMVFASDDSFGNRLMLAGCDPAIGLLSRAVERLSGVEIVSAAASSRLALRWLAEGKLHIAGMHLKDPQTGEFNLPILRREYPGEDFAVVTFAKWEEGFVTAAGNPKKIRNPEHLARRGVRFINRESGSGSRSLLDQLLKSAGVDPRQVSGYDRIAYGHLAAAYAVFSQDADCCVATRSAAQTFGLGFVPLESERYDFVVRRRLLDTPGVQNFLDALQRATLRRKLEGLAGYDTAQTGAVLA
jgi:molybdate-binding protein